MLKCQIFPSLESMPSLCRSLCCKSNYFAISLNYFKLMLYWSIHWNWLCHHLSKLFQVFVVMLKFCPPNFMLPLETNASSNQIISKQMLCNLLKLFQMILYFPRKFSPISVLSLETYPSCCSTVQIISQVLCVCI